MAFVSDTDLAATGSGQGANMVGFKQPQTAAIARTAMEKIRETLSVKDFGAVGDLACSRFGGHRDKFIQATPASRSKSIGLR